MFCSLFICLIYSTSSRSIFQHFPELLVSLLRWTAAQPYWRVCQLRGIVGRRPVRPSRTRCPPSLETVCSLQHSLLTLATLNNRWDRTCSLLGLTICSRPTFRYLKLWSTWPKSVFVILCQVPNSSSISQFRTDIARTEYLSNADERLRWQANSLPADDLCTENAIMLKRFNRSVSFFCGIVMFLGFITDHFGALIGLDLVLDLYSFILYHCPL